uniref:Uncharacterized protein n=1 Tax=Trichogramma kaykai TaxID=54128 RepID=A0ABD2WAZ4_9HYME
MLHSNDRYQHSSSSSTVIIIYYPRSQQKSLEQQQQLTHMYTKVSEARRCNRQSECVNRCNGNFQSLIIATRFNKSYLRSKYSAKLLRLPRYSSSSSLLVRVAAPRDFTGCSYISSTPHRRVEMPLSLDGEYYITCQSASGKSK